MSKAKQSVELAKQTKTVQRQLSVPVSCTVWLVTYEFKKPARVKKLPRSSKKEDDTVENRVAIVTADPTGADNYRVAKLLVLGETPHEGNDFRILHFQRMTDAMGFAQQEPVSNIAGNAPAVLGGLPGEGNEEDEDSDPEGEGNPPASQLN